MTTSRFDVGWLREHPDYIDILESIIKFEMEFEENNPDRFDDNLALERYNEKHNTEHTCYWRNTKAGNPQKLYQLETHGFLDRVRDPNSGTFYSMSGFRDEIKEIIDDMNIEETDSTTKVEHGEYREIYFDFPSSEDELPEGLFEDIVGLDDKKWILRRGLTTEEITNFLLLGDSGTAKSIFLLSIYEYFKNTEYIVASEATSAGVIDELFAQLPKIYLVDEFDDLKKKHQSVFSSYTETGILKETKSGKNRKVETNIKTFAAANHKSKIKNNILDRFTILEFEPYTHNEFQEICEKLLPNKEGKSVEESRAIADAVWDYKEEGDVRAAIQVARLSRGDPQKVVEKLKNEGSDIKNVLRT